MLTAAQKRARANYDKVTKVFLFRLRRDKDADIIERFEEVGNKTDYLRRLVRADIDVTK